MLTSSPLSFLTCFRRLRSSTLLGLLGSCAYEQAMLSTAQRLLARGVFEALRWGRTASEAACVGRLQCVRAQDDALPCRPRARGG
jgi:hypothetical protein